MEADDVAQRLWQVERAYARAVSRLANLVALLDVGPVPLAEIHLTEQALDDAIEKIGVLKRRSVSEVPARGLSFSEALSLLTSEHEVRRASWEHDGVLHISHDPSAPIYMRNAGADVPWVLLQSDLLARDWVDAGRPTMRPMAYDLTR